MFYTGRSVEINIAHDIQPQPSTSQTGINIDEEIETQQLQAFFWFS
jgi:hypothetical protein